METREAPKKYKLNIVYNFSKIFHQKGIISVNNYDIFCDQSFHIVENLENKFKLPVAYKLYAYTDIYALFLGSGLKKQTHNL